MSVKNSISALTYFEKWLWAASAVVVIASFFFGNGQGLLSCVASLIGVTALIFVAKGDLLGQVLTIIFSVLYGIVSFQMTYYGEMITYLGMTAPMAALAVISWKRHPYEEEKSQVKVSHLTKKIYVGIFIVTVVVTFAFYFILRAFHTANLSLSTVSVATSFVASSLTFFRSEYYALAYAANDVVLIGLWVLATWVDIAFLPMVLCFVMFFVNDMYGFYNWKRMKKLQKKEIK